MTRAEFNRIVDLLNERGDIVERHTKELDIQLKRMAQMQSELDEMRNAWQRLKRTPSPGSEDPG